jgi:hypothetical protein
VRLTCISTALILVLGDLACAADVENDSGGVIAEYALSVAKAQRKGKRVKLRGRCASACTLYLSLPKTQLCLGERVFFVFHAPYGSSGKANAEAKAFLQKKYPKWVQSWINSNGGLTNEPLTMPRAYAIKFLDTC